MNNPSSNTQNCNNSRKQMLRIDSIAYYWSKLLRKARLSAIKSSRIDRSSKVESGCQVVDSTMGRHSFCGYNCELFSCDIGAFCSIANGVTIGGGRHPMEWVGMSPVFYEGKDSVKEKFAVHKRRVHRRTVIGNDVWIGRSALIGQGVIVGNGAVIGMGSVVTKDVADYAIVAGVPARKIRNRFDEQTIQDLLEIEWWHFSEEQLHKFAKYFTDPRRFIEEYRSR